MAFIQGSSSPGFFSNPSRALVNITETVDASGTETIILETLPVSKTAFLTGLEIRGTEDATFEVLMRNTNPDGTGPVLIRLGAVETAFGAGTTYFVVAFADVTNAPHLVGLQALRPRVLPPGSTLAVRVTNQTATAFDVRIRANAVIQSANLPFTAIT